MGWGSMTGMRAHDDLEAILSEVNTADDERIHAVAGAFDATFTSDYEKAKTSQWNGSVALDPERTAAEFAQYAVENLSHRLSQFLHGEQGAEATHALCHERRGAPRRVRGSARAIVPNCKRLGLLDDRDTWLRLRFQEIGVIEYEHYGDTGIEYAELNAVVGV